MGGIIGDWKSANGDSRSGAIVELFYEEGYNVLMVDREHTALNTETVLEHIRAARALRMPCVVRVADDVSRAESDLRPGAGGRHLCTANPGP